MVILGPQNTKLLAEMDFSYQKTSETTYCTTFCDNYLKSKFSKMQAGGHLGFMQISGDAQSCHSSNQTRLVLEHL